MTRQVFTASQQMAIDWVLRTLVFPGGNEGWDQPRWLNFSWFTSIQAESIRPIDRTPRNRATVISLGKPGDEFVQRDVVFFLGKDEVARLTLHGLKAEDSHSTNWKIADVRYATTWPLTQHTAWIHGEFLSVTYSGKSPLVAPEG